MNLKEYHEVSSLTYLQYCDYLQAKYGKGKYNYMTKTWDRNSKVSRTKEGLLCHHKCEDRCIMLATKEIAMKFPYAWQEKDNLVYCNYLEHLLLHVLICKYPSPETPKHMQVGVGGAINFLIPELNDFYSGWSTEQAWRKTCLGVVKNDKEVYLAIIKQLKDINKEKNLFDEGDLCSSYNAQYGLWNKRNNLRLYAEIKLL